MQKNSMNIAKGIGTGLMAGMVVGYVGGHLTKNNQGLKKKTNKAMNDATNLFNDIQHIFK